MADAEIGQFVSWQTTHDTFFGGRLVLEQPAGGHRSGTDAVLLAAAIPRDFSGLAYDIGAGVGAIGLGIALFCQKAQVVLAEKDPGCVALAQGNIERNGLKTRVEAIECNIFSDDSRCASLSRKADLVVTNPPFYQATRVRPSQDPYRRAAHVLDMGIYLKDWLLACLDCLVEKGILIVLHHTEAVSEILDTYSGRLGGLTLLAVHPRVGQPATRVLIRGQRGSRSPFRIAAPLILHDGDRFTPQALAIHEGTAPLDW